MLNFAFEQDILRIEARGALSKNDFERLTGALGIYLNEHKQLRGVLIHTQSFPGWDSLGGFGAHMDFVRANHSIVRRVALATDSVLADMAEALVEQFSSAKVRHFAFSDDSAAMKWLQAG